MAITATGAASASAGTTSTAARTATLTTKAAATRARLLRARLIDGQGTTINALAVERGNGGLGLLLGAHFDKTETL